MKAKKELTIENFRLGQRRDGALRNDALWSMYSLENFDIDYVEGSLKIRPGYEEWNLVELPDIPAQLYNFVNLENQSEVLGICGNRWYVLSESGDHAMLIDEAATSPRPIITVDNRVIFATDSGIYWADYDSLTAATPTCYRLGILKPALTFGYSLAAVTGYTVSVAASPDLYLNTTTRKRVAFKHTFASTTTVRSVKLCINKPSVQDLAGSIKIIIYTDDGGSPSETVADVNANSTSIIVGDLNITGVVALEQDLRTFILDDEVELVAGTYWFVIISDFEYKDNFDLTPGAEFYVNIIYDQPGGTGYVKVYNDLTSTWVDTNYRVYYQLNGIGLTSVYDYVMTYYNTSYASESRPSNAVRLDPTSALPSIALVAPSPADPQIDKIRFYRRSVDDMEVRESDITDEYKYVGEIDPGGSLTDDIIDDFLGGVLQTEDHYCYDEIDDEEGIMRDSAIIPLCMEFWKDRIWASKANDNRHYFTKVFEQDGATGPTNEATIDYFPLDNIMDIPASSSIIQLKRITQDQLATYYNDESIYILFGANESLNPPSDIVFRDLILTGGLFGTKGIDIASNSNIIITREGLYRFAGTVGGNEYLSETNKSIIALIDNTHLDDCFPIVFGDEIYLFIDTNNDGKMETILILDLSRDVPSRNIMDRSWRTYKYPFKASCAVVRKKGAAFREMLVGDAEDNFLYRINTGTDDNGAKITGLLETHALKARNMVHVSGVKVRAKYASSTMPAYTITGISGNSITDVQSFTPASVNDIRGHNMGIGLPAHPDARLRVEIEGMTGDELILMIAEYVQE